MTHDTDADAYWLILNRETGQAWSNDHGWVDGDTYDLFDAQERESLNLPIGGYWHSPSGEADAPQGESPKPALRWTAGPWDFHIGQDYAKIETADGFCIAEIRLADDGRCEADAQLMAAAPDMASALLEVEGFCESGLNSGSPEHLEAALSDCLQIARAALLKAGVR